MTGRSEVTAPFAFHPKKAKRRNAQLAKLRKQATQPQMTIKEAAAYAIHRKLSRLLQPKNKERMLAKGVTKEELRTLKKLVDYYRDRALSDRPRDRHLEAQRQTLLEGIIDKVQSAA